jgi:anti-sigma factor RsiW
MRPCERTDSLLSAYIEGETSPAETHFLDAHLASCPRCRTQKTTLETLLSRLRALPRVDVSPGFTERVLARTADLEPAGVEARPAVTPIASRWSWSVPMATAAALLVVVWGVTHLRSGATPAPDTARETPAVTPPGAPDAAPAQLPEDALTAEDVHLPRVDRMQGAGDDGEWLDGDVYLLENFELRQPAGGGSPTLTRASGQAKDRVVVTF